MFLRLQILCRLHPDEAARKAAAAVLARTAVCSGSSIVELLKNDTSCRLALSLHDKDASIYPDWHSVTPFQVSELRHSRPFFAGLLLLAE